MTNEQEHLTFVYGWTSFALVVLICVWILKRSLLSLFYRSNYEACGDDQGIPFSNVPSISSYIPEVKSNVFPYALIAVDTNNINEELFEWKDPDKPFSYYDLTRDMRGIIKDRNIDVNSLFSKVQYWAQHQQVVVEQTDAGECREQYQGRLC